MSNAIFLQKKRIEMSVNHINKAEFLKKVWNFEESPSEWKFIGERPAIVDFYATWCGPCQRLAPVLDELSDEYAGRIDIYKVDTGAEEELSEAFRIRSIPTLLFCPMGEVPQVFQGALPKGTIKQIVDTTLLK